MRFLCVCVCVCVCVCAQVFVCVCFSSTADKKEKSRNSTAKSKQKADLFRPNFEPLLGDQSSYVRLVNIIYLMFGFKKRESERGGGFQKSLYFFSFSFLFLGLSQKYIVFLSVELLWVLRPVRRLRFGGGEGSAVGVT